MFPLTTSANGARAGGTEMASGVLVANARMYSVSPEASLAWARLFDWLSKSSGVPLAVVEHPYPAALSDLWARTDLGAAFICGWPYARRMDDLQIVAAPIPRVQRTRGRALYWTDLVVKADRSFGKLEDTFGGRIAFTSEDSHSGFNAVRKFLIPYSRARGAPLYSSAIGPLVTPRRSLESVLSDAADVAPVDSYAHALLKRYCPSLTNRVRTIAVTDLSPIPILVASNQTDKATVSRMRAALIGAERDSDARPLLDDLLLDGFMEVDPEAYAVTQSWARDADIAGFKTLA